MLLDLRVTFQENRQLKHGMYRVDLKFLEENKAIQFFSETSKMSGLGKIKDKWIDTDDNIPDVTYIPSEEWDKESEFQKYLRLANIAGIKKKAFI